LRKLSIHSYFEKKISFLSIVSQGLIESLKVPEEVFYAGEKANLSLLAATGL